MTPGAAVSDPSGRASIIVDAVITRAASAGERAMCFARLSVALTFLVVWPLVNSEELLAGLYVSDVVVLLTSLAAAVFSVAMLAVLRTRETTRRLSLVSILVDVGLVLAVLLAFSLEGADFYMGTTRMAGFSLLYFAIMGAGVRLTRRGGPVAAVASAVGAAGLLWADRYAHGITDSPANITTALVLIVVAAVFSWLTASRTRSIALEGAAQTLRAERARDRLGAYVSEEVATAALASDALHLGGKRQQVAVLFTDLRSFTTASENADPEQLVAELNAYFEVMVAAVTAHGGVVDKYIGDSIMAVFGAPMPRPDDAARALRAAHAMERALVALNGERAARGLSPLRHGVGVHFGVVVAGNVGTTARAQYTVIGDTVNVAARLESATKDQGVSVLVSSAVVAAAGGASDLPALRMAGSLAVKGRTEPIATYTFAPARL